MDSLPPFQADFDDSYFDKDCFGTVTCRITVTGDGEGGVRIRRWGDEAGQDAYDRTITTRIDAVLTGAKVIRLVEKPWYLELDSKRPIDGSRHAVGIAGPALSAQLSDAHLANAATGLAAIIVALGGPMLTPPALRVPGLPPGDSQRFDVDLGDGFRMTAVIRPAYTRVITPGRQRPPRTERGRDTLHLVISREAEQDREGISARVELRDNGAVHLGVTGGLEVRDRVSAALRGWTWGDVG